MGVSQQTLSKWEQGRIVPSLDVQARLAAILGVSVGDIFAPLPDEAEAISNAAERRQTA